MASTKRKSAPASGGLKRPYWHIEKPKSVKRAEHYFIFNKELKEYLEWTIDNAWKEYEKISWREWDKKMDREWKELWSQNWTEQEEKECEAIRMEKKEFKTKMKEQRKEYKSCLIEFRDWENILKNETDAWNAMMEKKKAEMGNDTE